MALTQDLCDQLLNDLNEALLEDEPLEQCFTILEKFSEPWLGSVEEIEGIIEYILFQIGEEGNSRLRLLLLPAY